MDYRFLGKTGLKVSELCIGTMLFGRELDEKKSHEFLSRFAEAGGNFIDTADVYSEGGAETIVGNWLKSRSRDSYVVATKVRFPAGTGPNSEGLSRKHIISSVESSLNRLKADYIDLYQVHCWDRGTPLEETLRTLSSLVDAGKVRYLGASNFMGWQLQKALDISLREGWEPFASLQLQYNLLCRMTEWEVLAVCEDAELGVMPWGPLRGGWLTGKYRREMNEPPEGTRVRVAEEKGWGERWSNYNNEHTWKVVDALLSVAHEVEKTPAQVALNWLLQKPVVTSPILGARTREQLENNLGASGWALSDTQMSQLDEASAVPLPCPNYPFDFIARYQSDR